MQSSEKRASYDTQLAQPPYLVEHMLKTVRYHIEHSIRLSIIITHDSATSKDLCYLSRDSKQMTLKSMAKHLYNVLYNVHG